MPSQANRMQRLDRATPGAPKRSKKACVCDRPSKMIEDTPNATSVTSARGPARLEQPAPERAPVDAALLVHQPEPGEPAEEPEPDRERLAVRAPLVAPELGHHREREGGVADEDDEQESTGPPGTTSSSQTKTANPIVARPATEPLRVVGRRPALDVGRARIQARQVVDRRERVEEVPGRADDRADDGQADPAVDPQEERRDVAVARPAGDPLGDDPQPADRARSTRSPIAQPGRRQRARRR